MFNTSLYHALVMPAFYMPATPIGNIGKLSQHSYNVASLASGKASVALWTSVNYESFVAVAAHISIVFSPWSEAGSCKVAFRAGFHFTTSTQLFWISICALFSGREMIMPSLIGYNLMSWPQIRSG